MKIHMAIVLGAVLTGFAGPLCAADQPAVAPPAEKAALTQAVYVCPHCHTMALNAGACAECKKDMTKMHVLGTKDGDALLCGCGAGCKCGAAGMKDGKCGCGKDVVKMHAKGMYVCPDGCPEISDKAGKCACGKEMKKVE